MACSEPCGSRPRSRCGSSGPYSGSSTVAGNRTGCCGARSMDFRSTLSLSRSTASLSAGSIRRSALIGFFPDWFASPQTDAAQRAPGRVPSLGRRRGCIAVETGQVLGSTRFLDAGEPPVSSRPGSAAANQCGTISSNPSRPSMVLGLHGMLITTFPDKCPRTLPRVSQPSATCHSARFCRARHCSCITAVSAPWHKPSGRVPHLVSA